MRIMFFCVISVVVLVIGQASYASDYSIKYYATGDMSSLNVLSSALLNTNNYGSTGTVSDVTFTEFTAVAALTW